MGDTLTPEEFAALIKHRMGLHLEGRELELLYHASEKNEALISNLRGRSFDVYLTGHVRLDNLRFFYDVARILEERGISVYHPAMVVMDSKEKGKMEFEIENRAKCLLVVTSSKSFGTSVDVGFFTHRKVSGESVRIVYCYLGPDYELKSLKDHPAAVYIDYFTNDLGDAIRKVMEFLSSEK